MTRKKPADKLEKLLQMLTKYNVTDFEQDGLKVKIDISYSKVTKAPEENEEQETKVVNYYTKTLWDGDTHGH